MKYQTLQNISPLKQSARNATLILAEYRSAIETAPVLRPLSTFHADHIEKIGHFLYIKDGYIRGSNAFLTKSGQNALDYTILENVVFEDTDITYNGGPVVLRNVRFINCRFIVPNTSQADQFLAATINQPAHANIG